MLVLSDLALIPSIQIMIKNRRHFEVFIGIFQFVAKFLFNFCEAINTEIFLDEGDWHFMADVLSLTYGVLLIVHLMSLKNENINICLRYMGFALAWIAKVR